MLASKSLRLTDFTPFSVRFTTSGCWFDAGEVEIFLRGTVGCVVVVGVDDVA